MKLVLIAVLAIAAATPALTQNMSGMGSMSASSMATAEGAGVVKAIDAAAGTVTIRHGPIAALKWPAMTMTFKASRPSLLRGVAVGQPVKFQLMKMGGMVQLTAISRK